MDPTANIHPNVSIVDRTDEMASLRQDLAAFVNTEERLNGEVRVGENAASRAPNVNSASTQAPGQESPSSHLRDAWDSTQERMPQWFRVAMSEAMTENRSSIMGAERPWARLMIEALNSSHRPRAPAHNQPTQPVQPGQAQANRGQSTIRHNSVKRAYWKGPKMTRSEKRNRAMKIRMGKIKDGLNPLPMADLAVRQSANPIGRGAIIANGRSERRTLTNIREMCGSTPARPQTAKLVGASRVPWARMNCPGSVFR
ncbi:hypothetical protein FA13DRAFT_1879195 [Coprinellus micaceus]|uniref:Uncharacterized protein n=1 Tax=Coprinellus micaceus TaxID=71717 RepID=A0A4Y7T0U2_COPMI|nr:hypothetical protein FA13DRAFT_1879195 [Coprinellus micaceus]